MEKIKAWHFIDGDSLRDGQLAEVGRTYHVNPPLRMCSHGLHASVQPLDALNYASGSTVCRVECWGDVVWTGSGQYRVVVEHELIGTSSGGNRCRYRARRTQVAAQETSLLNVHGRSPLPKGSLPARLGRHCTAYR